LQNNIPLSFFYLLKLDNNNIVQLDLLDLVIICDPGKLDEQGCKGAPDLVIEIISPFIQEKIVFLITSSSTI
jgi:hypothetical protein